MYDAGLKAAGLSAHQFNVLMTLRQAGPVTVGGLASLTGMAPSTVPRLTAPLIAKGWIKLAAGVDRRRKYLLLTAAGRRKIDSAEGHWRAVQTGLIDRFGAKKWLAMMADLKTLGAQA